MGPLRLIPPLYWVAAFLTMAGLHWFFPMARLLIWPWNLAGMAPIAVGLVFDLWCAYLLVRHKTTVKPGRKSTTLLTAGPFALSRNPIYGGMALMLAGIATLLGSASSWIAVALFVLAIDRIVIPVEEAMLRQAFGEAYEAYRKRVRRWV